MPALPSLKQLQYLVALSEHLSFTRAADACFVTQSTLSAGLKELEETLGARLVERDRQGVLMTPVGEEVVRRARGILGATQDLGDFVAGASRSMSGLLRLGVIPTIAPFFLPRLLPALRRRYPALKLALCEELTANLLTRLDEGRLDFVLIALPFDTGARLVEPLFDDPLWLVGRIDAPELEPPLARVTPQLSEHLILLAEGHCLREHSLQACEPAAARRASEIEATSLLTLVQMVEAGLGLGLVPHMAVRAGLLKGSRLVARPFAGPGPTRTVTLATRRSSSRLADFQALAQTMREIGAAPEPAHAAQPPGSARKHARSTSR